MTRLDTWAGREELLVAAWGPKSVRDQVKSAALAGALGASGGSFVDACGGCDPFVDDIRVLLVFLALFIVVAAVWLVAGLIRQYVRRRRFARLVHGAHAAGGVYGSATRQVGVIAAGPTALDPVKGRRCVAFSTVLRRFGKVMLRDAVTVGFDLELESGDRVRIPAGLCVIEVPRGATVEGANLKAYRLALDPLRVGRTTSLDPDELAAKVKRFVESDLDPFPADQVGLVTLAVGQRVEIANELEPVAGGASGYREPACVLVPRGLVRLRPC